MRHLPSAILGLDIGGANVKAYHTQGVVRSRPFRMWEKPHELVEVLSALQAELPSADLLAVTMTGELCDCFESKRQGVHAILDAVEASARSRPIRVWQNDGRFVEVAEARATHLKTAAANWLALAMFAGRFAPVGPALLIDIGSTTADIIPLYQGEPVPQGRTDPERLRSRELVYTGMHRTPLCALLGEQVMAELFATTLDVYLLLRMIEEDPADHNTADHRAATRSNAEARLARMLGADLETSTAVERHRLAEAAWQQQTVLLRNAVRQVLCSLPAPPLKVILSGEGEFLARHVLREPLTQDRCDIVSFAETIGPAISQAACAYAVALLARAGET